MFNKFVKIRYSLKNRNNLSNNNLFFFLRHEPSEKDDLGLMLLFDVMKYFVTLVTILKNLKWSCLDASKFAKY